MKCTYRWHSVVNHICKLPGDGHREHECPCGARYRADEGRDEASDEVR